MATIGVSIIAKNEEQMIGACLESVKDADEIIVLDTGSEDKTVEIASKYAKVLTHYKWNDNFSEARNEAQKHCTTDWIVIIDCDEVASPGFISAIRAIVGRKENTDMIALTCDVQTALELINSPRVLKNIPEMKWEDPAHNRLPIIEAHGELVRKTHLLINSGFSPNHKKDKDRTLRILKKAIKEEPHKLRYYYYISREYLSRQMVYEAIHNLEFYCENAEPSNESADAHFLAATCYWDLAKTTGNQGMYMKAWNHAWECVKTIPTTKDAWKIITSLSNGPFKKFFAQVVEMADNDHVMMVRNL